MGSDLHMNPPAPDKYRASWNGNICTVERQRDGIYGEGNGWKEVWKGVPTADVKQAFTAMGFVLPPKPKKVEEYQEQTQDLIRYVDGLSRDLNLRLSYSGDPDPGGTKMLSAIVPRLKAIIDK